MTTIIVGGALETRWQVSQAARSCWKWGSATDNEKGKMTYTKDVPLTRFPSHERRLAIDSDSYEDLVQPVPVEIAWMAHRLLRKQSPSL
jgi:hypothetical protein